MNRYEPKWDSNEQSRAPNLENGSLNDLKRTCFLGNNAVMEERVLQSMGF